MELPITLEPEWLRELSAEFESPYMQHLSAFLKGEEGAGKRIFPPPENRFEAFSLTPLDRVKVVILGQDPYHGEGQAHGLCFSVLPGVSIPPSLQNIYKELEAELAVTMPAHGCLTSWSDQGVFLLNSVLTVEDSRAGSHRNRGWETFTDKVIEVINRRREGVVFMLWGSYAQRKGRMIDTSRHCVLTAPHPSPLSAYRGFWDCGHFRKANDYLRRQGQAPIEWSVAGL